AMLAVVIRLPPLVGFLAAGFALNALNVPEFELVQVLADLGVTLLLFGIGLKLDVRSLLRTEVWVTASVHMVINMVIAAGFLGVLSVIGFGLAGQADLTTIVLVAFAVSFSSTVFVVKVLSDRSESQSHYGRVAIGILIIQDIAAVLFLTAAKGDPPSLYAFLLLLLFPAAWAFRKVWDLVPHGEMQALFGIVMALVPGYAAFEAVGLKGDLGALIIGALLATHPAAGELSKSLFTIKELLLVGFFISIGYGNLPTASTVALAGAFVLLLPLKTGLFFLLLWWRRLGHRSSILSSLALGNYSEFALIVTAVGVEAGLMDEEWLVVLSVAVAISFVISAVVNRSETALVKRFTAYLPAQDERRLHPEDRPIDLSRAQAVVFGMGRIGRSAYTQLESEYGLAVVGVESDLTRVEKLTKEGLDVQEADATDASFWERTTSTTNVRLVVLAMPFHGSNLVALERLTEANFTGRVAVICQYDDQAEEIRERGAHTVLQLYSGAGKQLADESITVDGEI
ncbi:MAG: cation:proton antiporter, partial [Ornithinimicrobium sp.]